MSVVSRLLSRLRLPEAASLPEQADLSKDHNVTLVGEHVLLIARPPRPAPAPRRP